MSNRPRPSILSLFDPLSDAGGDQRADNVSPDSGSDKENKTPNSKQRPSTNDACSETLFFKRTYSRNKGDKATMGDDIPPVPPLPGAKVHLVDVGDEGSEVHDVETTITRKDAAIGDSERQRTPLSEVKSTRFHRNVDSLRVAATKNHASMVQKALPQACDVDGDSITPSTSLQDITQDQIVYDVCGTHDGTSTPSYDSSPSQSFPGSPTIKVSLLPQASVERIDASSSHTSHVPHILSSTPSDFNIVPSLSLQVNSATSTAQLPTHPTSLTENSPASNAKRFEDHLPRQDFGIRRLSIESQSSFSFKRLDVSTDLVNDEMSFMMNLDENSFLDHSKLGNESSRIRVPAWESDTTPKRACAIKENTNKNEEADAKLDANISVFSPPTLTSTPPSVPMGIVQQVINEGDEDVELQESNSGSPPSMSTDSGASGESNKTITPPSSPGPALAVAAPMKKKRGSIQPIAKRLHTRSESVPVNNIATQPLVIKKKPSGLGSGLMRSNSTTTANPLVRRRSSLMPSTTAATAAKEVKDAKEVPVAKVGGARRVPLTADAPLLHSKAKQEMSATAKSTIGSKGPQRPPRPSISQAPSGEPRTGPGVGSRNPSLRLPSSAPKPRPLSLQLPSTFSVSSVVPPSATKNRLSNIASGANGSSKLPQPQLRSKIPGPSSRSVSGLRKVT